MQFSTPRPLAKLATSIALAGSLGLAGGAAVMAQDATPAGTPIGPEASCVAPAATAVAVGSPATTASPVAGAAELPEGTVVEDQATIDQATAAIENLYACYNAGDGEAFLALFTENGHAAVFGSDDHAALVEHIAAKSAVAPAGPVEVFEVVDFGDGTLGVDYQVHLGSQVIHNLDVLTQSGDAWLVDNRVVEAPETNLDSTTASIKASIEEGGVLIEVSPAPVMNQPAVKFQITNNADSAIDVVIFQGGDAASVTSTDISAAPEGVTFVGEAHNVGAGQIVDTAFEELPEGNYVIVVQTANGETGSFDLTIDPPFDPNA